METLARFIQPTSAPPYVCNTEHLMREIRNARVRMFAQTARWPCAIRLHPADEAALIVASPMNFTPMINAPHMDCLLSMTVIRDPGIPLGASQLDRCHGCDSIGNICEHSGQKET